MDVQWGVEQLEIFLSISEPRDASRDDYLTLAKRPATDRQQVMQQWAVVRDIVDEVYPDWQDQEMVHVDYEFGKQRDAAIAALARLRRHAEIQKNMTAVNAVLSSDQFHPWVWTEAVRTRWARGGYDDAVLAASREINEQLRRLAGHDELGETKLVAELLGPNPKPGRIQLVASSELDPDTARSVQDGTLALGRACFLLARNSRSHRTEETDRQYALEHLAMLSAFAREVETFEAVQH